MTQYYKILAYNRNELLVRTSINEINKLVENLRRQGMKFDDIFTIFNQPVVKHSVKIRTTGR